MPVRRPGSPVRPASSPAGTVTIRDVELVRAGTWDAITGRVTITPDELDDIVAAAADPEVDAAPIKIGHLGAWADLGDSAPALGWVANVRRTDDNRVVGDLVDVPQRLAAILPKAFRRRSVEMLANVRTVGGKVYKLALTGLALLGVAPPAVKGLADLLALYDAPERPVAAGDHPAAGELVELPVVEGDIDAELAGVIAAASTALAGSVTAGEATQASADAILDRIFATAGVADATIPPPDANPGNTSPNDPSRRAPMPLDEARIRELLGVEADADVEATITDLRTRAEQAPADPPDPNAPPADPNAPPADPAAPPAPATPPAPPAPQEVADRIAAAGATVDPDGTVRLSAGSFASLLDGVALGQTAAATLAQQERDRALDDAIRNGRITPDERPHFAAQFAERPPAELVTFLGGLAQRFPVVELGAATASTDVADEAWDSFMADTFGPELSNAGGQ